jgi:hypothetical protein
MLTVESERRQTMDARIEKGIKEQDDWIKRDGDAWETAAAQAIADGYKRKASRYFPATFHKDGQAFVLVRSLGKLDWHLREILS